MSRILNFVREKAFVLILLGSIIAAAVTGIWAMNTVQNNLNQGAEPDQTQLDDFAGFSQAEGESDTIWNEPADIVTDDMNGEITMEEQATPKTEDAVVLEPGNPGDGANAPDSQPELSTESSGASSLSEPSEASAVLEPQEIAVTPSFVLPVTGSVLQSFTGEELVYNETLGDWRTHNGVDYAASLGESVIAPVAGQITAIYTDGNWGGVVELLDASGNTWRFCGVENSPLTVGQAVTISQTLGEIGIISAESGAEPHLHLEILQDGSYQNPSDYIK